MDKYRVIIKGAYLFLALIIFFSGCGPTYPKGMIPEAIKRICLKEYDSYVEVKIVGKTLAVYLPIENLFNAVFNINPDASKKINGVILGASRVVLSTDQEIDFYIVIAQDPKVPEIELLYIRYVEDVKRFLLGDISRGEYAKRAVVSIITPSRAQKEKILREMFEKLNIENVDEILKEYIKEKPVTTLDEICYWNNEFYIKEIELNEFLAMQIRERIKLAYGTDKELAKWFELRGVKGKFSEDKSNRKKGRFFFEVDYSSRINRVYTETGMEFGALYRKKKVLKKLLDIVSRVLWAYKFEDYYGVKLKIPDGKVILRKDEVWAYKKRRLKIDDLV